MKLEKALFIVKPEAFEVKEAIKDFITRNSKLRIINACSMILNSSDIESIYIKDRGTELIEATKQHFSNRLAEVCIVDGENAAMNLRKIIGEHFNPDKCSPTTVRYIFGRQGAIQYGNVKYFMNAVHKTDPSEVHAALSWFGKKTIMD